MRDVESSGQTAAERSEPAPPDAGLLRRWARRLAALDENPHRTSLAFALGVFLSFSPFLGLQILLGMALAFAFRLSRAAVFVGLCVNLPWIVVPWYAATTTMGAAVLGMPVTADLEARLAGLLDNPIYRAAFWEQITEVLKPFLWSFVFGSVAGAAVLGVLSYFIMARVLVASTSAAPRV